MSATHLKIATFDADVTPPVGHPLCAGWYGNAAAIADPLHAKGVVLTDGDRRVVLCALDWAELSNTTYMQWRQRLAEAAGTEPNHVAVQCVHAHCTPWPDAVAQQIVADHPDIPQVMDPDWCESALQQVAKAVHDAADQQQTLTHVGVGQAAVHQVASNRRILGPDAKVSMVRWTKTTQPEARAAPEGLIDPILRTVSFWNGEHQVAAMHYYAVHPTSFDRDHTVTPDFVGLARQRRQHEQPQTMHIYFTGCAGNITAGKYNDGAKKNRSLLTDRIYQAMVMSQQSTDRYEVRNLDWRVEPVQLPPRPDLNEAQLLNDVRNSSVTPLNRNRSAVMIAYLRRCSQPIDLTCLTVGDHVKILHLPGEAFIEYQLDAQRLAQRHMIAVAAYGDCGPGYICLERSFDQGGYEPTDSFVAPQSESIMRDAIAKLIHDASIG